MPIPKRQQYPKAKVTWNVEPGSTDFNCDFCKLCYLIRLEAYYKHRDACKAAKEKAERAAANQTPQNQTRRRNRNRRNRYRG